MGKSVRRPREVPAGHKHCLQCDKTKPHDQWSRATRTKDGLATACKTCMAARGRRDYFKRTYGLTEERLQELLRAQRGVCAICLGPGPEHVDHDHISGRVRGLLCFQCNIALGHLRDRPDVIRRAADYVEGHVWQPIPSAPGVFLLPSSPPAAPRSPSSSPHTPPRPCRVDVGRLRPP